MKRANLQDALEEPLVTSATAPGVEPAGELESRYYTRFTPSQRALHVILMLTFLGLAATGLPLRFSSAAWSVALAKLVGGFAAVLFFHKLCAVILTIAFLAHVVDIAYRLIAKKQYWMLWGPNSMVPNLKDLKDLIGQMRWFLFLGPKPKYDRFTYWQKLDYWGVFWGMAIIGISGYAMWFSRLFARLFPGSWLNIAIFIHGEEALLATGYIFVVHFFNEHLRPGHFPMDVTVFTGSQKEEEFREAHPEEYARAVEAGQLEQMRTKAPSPTSVRAWRVLGAVSVVVGVALIVLTAEAFIKE